MDSNGCVCQTGPSRKGCMHSVFLFFPKREVAELFAFLVGSQWTKANFPASEYLRVEDSAIPANG